ncbi:DNA polymerase III subunit beta, partial [Thermodesulfitimonas sp.]
MHFRITKENFLTAINTALRAVPSRSPLPVATALLVRAADGKVEVTGSDLEFIIRCSAPAGGVYREGEAAIPARQLAEIVRRISDSDVEIEATGPNVILTYKGGEVQLAAFLPEEFPLLGDQAEATEVLELGADFRDALRAVLYAAGKDELRPVFTGVQVQVIDGILTLAATDGHRLAVYEMAARGQGVTESLIPAKALREVERVLTQTGGS